MDWRKVKDAIGTIAPGLGAVLGGPLGGTAGAVLARVLLAKDKATPEELMTAIHGATPEKLAEVRAADQKFILDMKALDIDVFALETQDRESARNLFRFNIWPQIILSVVYNVGYFTLVIIGGLNPTFKVDPNLMTVLTTAIPLILWFWFGSTFGSQKKDPMLAASQPVVA